MLGGLFTFLSLAFGFAFALLIPFFIGWSLSIPYFCEITWSKKYSNEKKDDILLGKKGYKAYLIPFKALIFYISLLNFKRPIALISTILFNAFIIFIYYEIYKFIHWLITP